MTDADFEKLAGRALDSIPARFRERMSNVAVCVEGECTDDPELLGSFDGASALERSIDDIAPLPERITLFQRTIEDEAAETDGDVYRVIRETLIHEIAHYLGYDETEIDRKFESRWRAGTAGS